MDDSAAKTPLKSETSGTAVLCSKELANLTRQLRLLSELLRNHISAVQIETVDLNQQRLILPGGMVPRKQRIDPPLLMAADDGGEGDGCFAPFYRWSRHPVSRSEGCRSTTRAIMPL
ncbi:hypothetical protein [Rhizobium leguminosarum]|uniref:hypothetical protein n=1 Tax=Rhizobium leguminosarum TaxID=384 RepID=UPI001C9629CC|nr:hypothetical protein [Rhizobium leguminosarum]MBY5387733.1 hypothetical protein [Rhizobium leguminosarum]MBY5428329.1 hypothetical protein [Rhizobium leguminosarum]